MAKYLVMTRRLPAFDNAWLDAHYEYLDGLRADGSLEQAGPFTDGSGCDYVLRSASRDAAVALARRDPLHIHGCSEIQVLEWNAR
jgi:uncharacterized protein YciI